MLVGRYRDATMDRKVELMAARPDVAIWQIMPRKFRDEFVDVCQEGGSGGWDRTSVPMIGRSNDPHRAIYRTLFTHMRAFRPDIVHVEEEPDSLAALQVAMARQVWAPNARLVLYTWQNLDRPKGWAVRDVIRFTLGVADAILCANSEAEALLGAWGYRGQTAVLPMLGVDARVSFPGPARQRPGLVVGYAGRLVAEKGLDTLLDALASLPQEVTVTIIGGGPTLEPLKTQARRLGVDSRVTFVPPVAPAEVPAQLRELDVLVLPSRTTRTWKEQFGRVLTEAMACGVPVVGSDSGAIPEVIGDAGLVFPEGDAAALARVLAGLLASQESRADLSRRGLARVQALYTQEHIAAATVAFYQRLVAAA